MEIFVSRRQAARLISRLHKVPEELIGKNIWEELPDLVGSKAYEEYHRVMAEQVRVNFELYYPPIDSWLDVRAYHKQNNDDNFSYKQILIFHFPVSRVTTRKPLQR